MLDENAKYGLRMGPVKYGTGETMSRLAEAPSHPQGILNGTVKPGDTYSAKVAKYIPGEIVAAYLAAQTVITASNNPANQKTWAFLAMIVILAALNPFYLKRLAKKEGAALQEKKAWKRQAAVSTTAFLVWVYALVAAPVALNIYDALIASLLLIVGTLFAGLVTPEEA
ncbi:FtsH-binding integral membrane protein [Pseudarthrobacter oxydans]|uniref:hypothetical protein n=1 Tax=Pseudarthrobacter oxydans TaxID=1671 RepID=UPI002784AF6A|nr:hypothetical protein [Pseudarthrobacter oxydans]MDP9981517.1 FtsH-binding integral membrane protein [Pseudarthrobacter oxydans]